MFQQSLLYSIDNGSICSFNLAIALWMSHRGESLGDLELLQPLLQVFICKIGTIITNQILWEAKPTDYEFPDKFLDVFSCGLS